MVRLFRMLLTPVTIIFAFICVTGKATSTTSLRHRLKGTWTNIFVTNARKRTILVEILASKVTRAVVRLPVPNADDRTNIYRKSTLLQHWGCFIVTLVEKRFAIRSVWMLTYGFIVTTLSVNNAICITIMGETRLSINAITGIVVSA